MLSILNVHNNIFIFISPYIIVGFYNTFIYIGLFNLRIYWQRRIRETSSARNLIKIAWGYLFILFWCTYGLPRSALSAEACVVVEQICRIYINIYFYLERRVRLVKKSLKMARTTSPISWPLYELQKAMPGYWVYSSSWVRLNTSVFSITRFRTERMVGASKIKVFANFNSFLNIISQLDC